MQIKETAYFKCSRETLFRHLEDPEKQKQWMKGLQSNEPTSLGPQRVGSTFRMVIREGAKDATYDGEVTAFDRPERLEVRFWGGTFPKDTAVRADYRLTEQPGRTRLDYTCTMEGKVGVFLRVLFYLIQIFARYQLRGFFKNLRALVEADPKARAA